MAQPQPAAALERRVAPLTKRQRQVLGIIARYTRAANEPPSVLYIARRLQLSRAAVREHIEALHRKGWLLSPAPGGLRCTHLP